MTAWTSDELDRIAAADELQITPLRSDGTPYRPTPVWVVRNGDGLYIRSYRGGDGAWYRAARADHQAHITAGGVDKDVTLAEEPDPATNDRIDDAYRTKYSGYAETYVVPMLAPRARATTLKLLPR
jgi:hypothetical protein